MTSGKVAISADGSTVLWKSTVSSTHKCWVTTNKGTNWTASTGLTFTCNPVGDPENSSKFYAYNPSDGYLYASTNSGLNFYQGRPAGHRRVRHIPGSARPRRPYLGRAGQRRGEVLHNSGVSFSERQRQRM